MSDDQTGSCPTCYRRDADEGSILCNPCRSRLRSWLAELPELHEELLTEADDIATPLDSRPYVAKGKYGGRLVSSMPADPVAHHLGGTPVSGQSKGGRVSGSKEPRLPIRVDPIDLTAAARNVWLLGEDQIGYESVASLLDFWVRDWREARGGREGLPAPTVPVLAAWLLRRVEDAMDAHPAIDEFFQQIETTRNALRGQLKLYDVPDYKHGIPCPQCQALTLVHHDGSEFVECGSCPAAITFNEYDEHVRTLAENLHQQRRAQLKHRKALHQLLSAMRSAGWQFGVRYDDGTRVLVWWRGDERVEVLLSSYRQQPFGSVWYGHDKQEGMTISVHTDWVERYGIGALQKLARAAGLLTAPRQLETVTSRDEAA